MGDKWTKNDKNWLIENYPQLGYDKCVKKLGRSKSSIENQAHKLNIKLNKEIKTICLSKSPNKCNVNPDLFYNITIKEVAYILGFMWSDGFTYKSKNGNNHHLGIKIIEEDMNIIKPIFESIGKWNYHTRKYDNNWKNSVSMLTNNKRIYEFLMEHDYHIKSKASPDKILNKIPDNLKPYFFLGVIDGDGCFYYYKPEKGSIQRQLAIASTYEQDWVYMENLCKDLGVKYKIKLTKIINKKTGKLNSSSQFRITNKDGICKIGDYIYQDLIGLKRKYKKFLMIKNH